MSKLKQACKDYMEFLKSEYYTEDQIGDYQNDVFEAALKQELGNDIFTTVCDLMRVQDETN